MTYLAQSEHALLPSIKNTVGHKAVLSKNSTSGHIFQENQNTKYKEYIDISMSL